VNLTKWLRGLDTPDEHGPLWPVGVGLDADLYELPAASPSAQIAWCYGAAGMAPAFAVAAEALGDAELREYSVRVAEGVWSRVRRHDFFSATLCHGMAGVLLIALDFAEREPYSMAADVASELLGKLLARADEQAPLIFRDHEPPDASVDQPAFLTGTAGVAATLSAAASSERPRWLAPFLFR